MLLGQAWEVANKLGMIGPAMEQPEYNMLHRQKIESDYVPIYQKYGLGTTIWSPLSSGVLTGKYSKDHIPPDSRLAMEKYKVRILWVVTAGSLHVDAPPSKWTVSDACQSMHAGIS